MSAPSWYLKLIEAIILLTILIGSVDICCQSFVLSFMCCHQSFVLLFNILLCAAISPIGYIQLFSLCSAISLLCYYSTLFYVLPPVLHVIFNSSMCCHQTFVLLFKNSLYAAVNPVISINTLLFVSTLPKIELIVKIIICLS